MYSVTANNTASWNSRLHLDGMHNSCTKDCRELVVTGYAHGTVARWVSVFWGGMENDKQNRCWPDVQLQQLTMSEFHVRRHYWVWTRAELIRLTKATMENSTYHVKIGTVMTDGFKLGNGLKQGYGLAPNLFNIALEYIIRQLLVQTTSTIFHKSVQLTLRRLMSYIYGAPILDVSRSHTTTQHSQ